MNNKQNNNPPADILIVDDDPESLRLLLQLLGQAGFKVRPARDGQQALSAARLAPPDLVLLDVLMPDMTGYEVCEALKAAEATRDLPVIFISGLNQILDKVRAFSVGGVDYVSKPFQNEEILARVRTHLTIHQLQKELHQRNTELQQEIAVRKRADKMLEKQNRALHALSRTTLEIGSKLDVTTLLPSILEHAVELLDAGRGGGIYLYDPDEQVLRLAQGIGINEDRIGVVLQLNEGMAGRVFQSAEPLIVNDYPAWEGRAEVLVAWPPSAVLGVPLFQDGQASGVLGLIANSQRRAFNQEDINLAQMFAAQVTVALQNARLYQQAQQEISERKAIEAKLRESEARYRNVVEDQTEVIARIRTDSTFTFVNDVFCRFIGKARSELVGQKWQPVAVAEDVPTIEASLNTLSPANPVVVVENRVYSGRGEIRWMQFVDRGFFDDQGQLIEIQVVGRDITERKQAELLLREANDTLQQRLLELTILNFIGQTLTTVLDIQTALNTVVHIVNRLFNAHATNVSIVDPVSKEVKIITSHNLHRSDIFTDAPVNQAAFGLDEQLLVTPIGLFKGLLLKETVALSGSQLQTSPTPGSVPQFFRTCCNTQAFLFVPLRVHSQTIGLLVLALDRPEHDFSPAEEHLADTIAGQIAGAVKIAQLFEEERRQGQLAESLRQVGTVLSSSLDRVTVLNIIVEQLGQVLPYQGAALALIAGDELVFVQTVGRTIWRVDDRLSLKNENVLIRVLQERQVVILPNVAEAESWPDWFRPKEPGSWMGAPLKVGRNVLGLLTIRRDQVGAYRPGDAIILQTFANQAALAIENTRLYEQAQTIAVDAERQRLARELHDSVTQSLYSLTLLTNGWAATAQRGESSVPQMARQFKQLEEISLQGLKEMRLLLHQLRPPVLEEVGLVAALQQRLDSVEQRVKVETRLLVQGEVDELPRALIDQLYAIAQEALTNILRHAQATEVIVLLRREDGRLTMAVTDNGVGFDPAMPSFGLGLESIRERTEVIGGQLEISSTPLQGTTVMVTVALMPEEGV